MLDGKQFKDLSVAQGKLVKLYQAVEIGASGVTVGGTTLADISGLSFTIPGAGTYNFEYLLLVTQSSATGIVGVSANFTSTPTRISQNAILANSTIAATYRSNQANNTAMVDNAARAIAGPLPTLVTGSITVAGSGTLSIRAQRSAGVTTIGAGSAGMLIQV